ncbi:sigma-70 family RNA polymerase sigma factor [Dyella sp. ASV21]|uniref:sigma-70 family RNA polymerase sigma factor n=1 Tax=Dyella sp. ASV21 TaxID=2795114 RepID=UPI0018EC0AC2
MPNEVYADMPTDPAAQSSRHNAAPSARFEALVLPYLDAAYNLAHWLTRNPTDAQDVVQEALLRALRYFDSFRGGDVRVWLLAIVRNTYYSWRTRSAHDPQLTGWDDDAHPQVDETPSPETLTLLAVDIDALRHALDRLPPPLREVIVLRELEECSYKDIATITEQKIGTVMSRLARARERLKVELTCHPKEVRRHDVR